VQAIGLEVRRDTLDVRLADGRRILVPIEFYPTLRKASAAQRRSWEYIGPGEGFRWEEIDLDLAAEDIAAGRRERVYSAEWRANVEAELKRLGLTNKPPQRKLRKSA
jgi:hypothetical protein